MEICKKFIFLILIVFSFTLKNSFGMQEKPKKYSLSQANEFWETCGLFSYIPYNKENPTKITPIRVAYHEASHVLLAKHYNHIIKHVTIKPSSKTYGITKRPEEDLFSNPEEAINVKLAGYVIETIKFGKAAYIIKDDLDKAAINALFIETFSFFTHKTAIEALEQCLTQTHKIISENLEIIETIARALLEKKTLTGEEIDLIFNSLIDTNKQ